LATEQRHSPTRRRARGDRPARRRTSSALSAGLRRAADVGLDQGGSEFLADASTLRSIQRRDRSYRLAVIVADIIAALLVVGLAMTWLPTREMGWTALLLPVLVPLVHWANGLYQRDGRVINKNTLDEAPILFRAATMTTVLAYLLQSTLLVEPIGAKVVAFVWLSLTIFVPATRIAARAAIRELLPPERCLVVGDHDHGRRLADKLNGEAMFKSELVGVMPLMHASGGTAHRADTTVALIAEAVQRLDVHRVFIAAGTESPQQELEVIQAAKAVGVKVSVLPRVLEVVGSAASYDYVDGLTILGVPRFGLSRTSELAKRAFDIASSFVLTVLASPLLIAIAIAVRLSGPGPIFFRQRRIGRDGHAFHMLKFRSMQDGADAMKDALRDQNEQDGGLFKIADDPRITRVGRFLRRTSLDELPQILNVLRGEMSLVGPRPLVPEEDRMIQGWHRRRLHLTPGMTGPWQVLGSSRIPLQEMVTIDYLYVANWSVWNDVKILLRTVSTVVARRGR
jgi:exopolysaccharide biosynthesis polyprenyl glycosylphosphotransferase